MINQEAVIVTENCAAYVLPLQQFSVCTIADKRAINNAIVHRGKKL